MKAPRGLSLVLAEGVICTLCSALAGLMYSRQWGPELTGIVAISYTLATICSLIAQLGSDQIVIARFVNTSNPHRLFTLVIITRGLASVLATLTLVTSTMAANHTFGPWKYLPYIAFLQNLFAVADILRLRAQALNSLHRQSPYRIMVTLLFFTIKMRMLMTSTPQNSVWTIATLSLIESTMMLLISWIISPIDYSSKISSRPNYRALKSDVLSLLRASLPLFAATIVVTSFLRLDYFALARWANSKELGMYASSMRVLELYLAIGNLALLQFLPQLVTSHQKPHATFDKQLRNTFGLSYAIALGIILFNATIGTPLIRWALGSNYEPVASTSTALCFLSIPLLSGTVRGFAISIQELHSYHLYCALLGLMLALPLLMWLVPAYGFRGALLADGITYLATAMLSSLMFPGMQQIGRAQWQPRLNFWKLRQQ